MRKLRNVVLGIGTFFAILGVQNVAHAAGWAELPSPTTEMILGLDCGSSSVCIGVGTNGAIVRTTDHKTWEAVSSGVTNDLQNVDMYSALIGIAVGDSGVILVTGDGGVSWTSVTGVTTEYLSGVSMATASIAYIAGQDGTIFKTIDGGVTWSDVGGSRVATLDAFSIDAYSSSIVYVVGKYGGAYKTIDGGTSWTALTTGTSESLYSVDAVSSTIVYMGGNNRTLVKTTNGSTFTAQSLPDFDSAETVTDIACNSANRCMATGYYGALSATSDSGATWTGETVPGGHELSSAAYYAVGLRFVAAFDGAIITYDNYAPNDITDFALGTGGTSTTDTTPEFTWTATTDDETSVLTYEIDVDSSGTWVDVGDVTSYTLSSALSVGTHAVALRALDEVGNISDEALLSFEITASSTTTTDTTAPTVWGFSPTTATAGVAKTFSVYVYDSSGIASCTWYVNSSAQGAMTVSGSSASKLHTFLSAGTYSVYASCTDTVGNSGTGTVTTITVSAASSSTTTTTTTTTAEEDSAASEAATGTLIKTACDAASLDVNDPCRAVYYYDGLRHAFPNEKVFFTWYDDFNDVVIVTKEFMSSVTLGKNVTYHPGTRMVKFMTVNTVYGVGVNGQLRAIASEDVAKSIWGSDWNTQIDDISDAFFGNYSFGESIGSTSDFDPDAVEASVINISQMFST